MYACFACVCGCLPPAWYPWWSEEGVGVFGTGVKDACEPSCDLWELNPGPLPEQQSVPHHGAISPVPYKTF